MSKLGTEIISESQILDYIPQRPPLVMVDSLVAISPDDSEICSGLKISADNIFCRNGKFTEPGLIENAAQTAALRMGFLAKRDSLPVQIGFIGAFNKLKINRLPNVYDEIRTTLKVKFEVMGIVLCAFETKICDELIASGEMKVALKN